MAHIMVFIKMWDNKDTNPICNYVFYIMAYRKCPWQKGVSSEINPESLPAYICKNKFNRTFIKS